MPEQWEREIDELLRKETNRQQSRLLELIQGRSSG